MHLLKSRKLSDHARPFTPRPSARTQLTCSHAPLVFARKIMLRQVSLSSTTVIDALRSRNLFLSRKWNYWHGSLIQKFQDKTPILEIIIFISEVLQVNI